MDYRITEAWAIFICALAPGILADLEKILHSNTFTLVCVFTEVFSIIGDKILQIKLFIS